LASLFKDAYIHWEEAEVLDWLIRYWEKARKSGLPVHSSFSDFSGIMNGWGSAAFESIGYLCASVSPGQQGRYLKDLPLVMDYLRRACERYVDLKPYCIYWIHWRKSNQSWVHL